MPRRLVLLVASLVVLASLAACTLDTPTLTPIPPPTPTLTVALPPSATPTVAVALALTPTAPANSTSAPSLAEIKAALARIYAHSNQDTAQAVQQYSASLKGKAIQGWDGWVTQLYQENGAWSVLLALQDPYASGVPPTVDPTHVPSMLTDETAEADLAGLPATTVARLRIGQHLRFSGHLNGVEARFGFSLQVVQAHLDQIDPSSLAVAPTLTVPPASTPLPPPPTPPAANPAPSLAAVLSQTRPLRDQDLAAYLQKLDGKTVQGWQVWVADIESGTITVNPDDPFAATPADMGDPANPSLPPLLRLTGLDPATAQRLRIGQRLQVSGILHRSGEVYAPVLEITAPQVAILEDRLAGLTAPGDLQDVMLHLERTLCYGRCPAYTVRVYGDGTVVWQGELNVQTLGLRITRIGAAGVGQLIASFTQTHFFALGDHYSLYMVTDGPSARMTFAQGGQSKTIDHYSGDLSAPTRLHLLENQIDYVLNTQQWIGNP